MKGVPSGFQISSGGVIVPSSVLDSNRATSSLVAARGYYAGAPDADPNTTLSPWARRGTSGIKGILQEMAETCPVISAGIMRAQDEIAAVPKEVRFANQRPGFKPGVEETEFAELCTTAALLDPYVYEGVIEGCASLCEYITYDAYIGFGIYHPRIASESGAVEWFPISHNAVMLWNPDWIGVKAKGAQLSTPQGYNNFDTSELAHVMHGTAYAGEFEGSSRIRPLIQTFEMWKSLMINAGIYDQMAWGWLDIAYAKSVGDADIVRMNQFAQDYQQGLRKYTVHPDDVTAEMRFPSGTALDVVSRATHLESLMRDQLNVQLGGLSGQSGSNAMASTISDDAKARARAFADKLLDRWARTAFRWLADKVGYEGVLPSLATMPEVRNADAAAVTAYFSAKSGGGITPQPADEPWIRAAIGAPELEPVESKADAVDIRPPLPVGSLVASQQILTALNPPPGTPALSPDAAFQLLIAAGNDPAAARIMVDAQVAASKAPAAPAPTPTEDATAPTPPAAAPAPVAIPPGDKPVAEPVQAEVTPTTTLGNVTVPAHIGDAGAFQPVNATASATMQEALELFAELADHPDVVVPESVKAACAAAIAAHRAARSVDSTSDATAITLARDLAAGRRIKWSRVLDLARWFSKDFPRVKGSKTFAARGPAWHQYQLRGGDAARAWCRDMLAAAVRTSLATSARLSDSEDTTLADTLDDVDTTPTDGMVEEAKRGLEWRKEHGRGGTEAGVARARDIANRKRLSEETVRRMSSYFARHEVDKDGKGWSPGDGFPSAGRIAWALWGGDAGATWASKVAAQFDRVRANMTDAPALHGPTCACCSDTEPSEMVIVYGGDGKAFRAIRPLRDGEEVVAWATMAETRASLDDALAARLDALAREHRAAIADALKDGWQPGERDRIWAEFTRRYQDELTKGATELRDSIATETGAEVKRAAAQGPGVATGGANPAKVESAVAQAANVQLARAAASTQVAGETIANRVQTEAENAILGGADFATWQSRITPKGLLGSATDSRNQIETGARLGEMATGPAAEGMAIEKLIRTVVPDGNACRHCRDADGYEVIMADWVPDDDSPIALPQLPDPECEGGPGRCRCGWFAVYGAAPN